VVPGWFVDVWGECDTFEPATPKKSQTHIVVRPGLCLIHEFADRTYGQRQSEVNKAIKLLFDFPAFVASFGVFAELNEFLVRQESPCFQCC
jgi:hypothetical protein